MYNIHMYIGVCVYDVYTYIVVCIMCHVMCAMCDVCAGKSAAML